MQRKLILNEAFSYNASDFSSGEGTNGQEVYQLVNNGEYQRAINEASLKDLPKVIEIMLNDEYKDAFYYLDDKTISLIQSWILAFDRSIDINKNPFMNYLTYLANKRKLATSYDTLVTINNKYNEGVLEDEDLVKQTMHPILKAPNFYDDFYYNQQEKLLDYWEYFGDGGRLGKILNSLKNNANITLFGNTPSEWLEDSNAIEDFRNLLFFGKIQPTANNKLRDYSKIIKDIENISKVAKGDDYTNRASKPTRDEVRSAEDIIRDNNLDKSSLRVLNKYLNSKGIK